MKWLVSEGAQTLFNPNEAKTRKELIDPALQKAGWDVNNSDQVGLEIPIDGSDPTQNISWRIGFR